MLRTLSSTSNNISAWGLFKNTKIKYKKLIQENGFALFYEMLTHKIYLTNDKELPFNLNIVASAHFAETEEAEVALLSNIQFENITYKIVLFDLLKNYLAKQRTDLFYSETSGNINIPIGVEACFHDENVMVMKNKPTQVSMTMPAGLHIVDDKSQLMNNLTLIKSYLNIHSNWARKNGKEWLTEERLGKRIKESSHTIVLLNAQNQCLGYVSAITNDIVTYIYNVSIHAQYRSKGLGKLLLMKLLEKVPEHQIVVLISAYEGPTIKYAKQLYEKLGFVTYARDPSLRNIIAVLNIAEVPKLTCRL